MKVKLGDKAKDLVSGFTGIVVAKIEHLNGCVQYQLAETTKDMTKNQFRTVDVDEQVVKKIDSGLNKKAPVKKKRTGGATKLGSYLTK